MTSLFLAVFLRGSRSTSFKRRASHGGWARVKKSASRTQNKMLCRVEWHLVMEMFRRMHARTHDIVKHQQYAPLAPQLLQQLSPTPVLISPSLWHRCYCCASSRHLTGGVAPLFITDISVFSARVPRPWKHQQVLSRDIRPASHRWHCCKPSHSPARKISPSI